MAMSEDQQAVLRILRDLLETIGSANDAEDHGYVEEVFRMRNDSCEAIRGLLAEHAFLAELYPKLRWELDTQHILGFGWSDLYDGVDAQLKAPVNGHGDG